MQTLIEYFTGQFLVFVLVLVRVSAATITSPIIGTTDIPPQVRVLFGLAVSVLIAPTQFAHAAAQPNDLVDLAIVVVEEAAIGIVLGLGVTMFLSGVSLAGQVIAQMGGIALADVYNPGLDTSLPLFSQLLYLVAMAIYVLMGFHRMLLAGLLNTFESMPPGTAALPDSILEVFITLLAASFDLGLRVAAPATVALLLATVILGLVSRALPQLNIMALGFGANIMVTFAALLISFGALAWLIDLWPSG